MKCTPNVRQKSLKFGGAFLMGKYSPELKREVVQYITNNCASIDEASRKFNINKTSIKKWLKHYEQIGPEAFVLKNNTYSGEFKVNVVEYMHINHLSLLETSFHFSVPDHTTVAKWERIYYEEGPHVLLEERRGRSKNMDSKPRKRKLPKESEEDLIAEVQQLRMENAYLKKLNALVQEKIKRENKKKYLPLMN